ncbi:hypothetical protein BDY24DRAFT_405012, partial [Mrakia frigida]|uniref:uncharacterized protein n=1 Tax=Mrakia frigida TaxID=29902 RepID=UPI003FCBF9B6
MLNLLEALSQVQLGIGVFLLMLGFSRALGRAGDEEEPEDDADDETNNIFCLASLELLHAATEELQNQHDKKSQKFTDQVEGEKFETIQEHFQ